LLKNPSQRRLKQWLALDCVPTAWRQLALRYQPLHGINGDKILLGGAKKPAKVVAPPPAKVPVTPARPVVVDGPAAPHAQADGAYGNRPPPARAQAAGFQRPAPRRGEKRPGAGKIRNAMERCLNFFAR
jgi:hypothetical protein